MKKRFLLFLLLALLISACAAPPADDPPAAAEPSETPLPPTATQTPEPTEIPTETPLPSPTPDLRIITEDPSALVLLTEDLPEEGNYFVSQDKGNISNEMIVYEFKGQLGEETATLVDLYLQETSRLDGYSQVWTRGSYLFEGPLYIANEIAIFKTARGAELEVTKYKPLLISAMDGRVPSHQEVQIGDQTRIYIDTVTANGQEADIILVEFSYRNVVIDIGCWGEKGKYDLDQVLEIAENIYQRLLELPLSEPAL
jgi:hypothetical protein